MAANVTINAQFIFRISGNGLEKNSYILGSLHVLSGDRQLGTGSCHVEMSDGDDENNEESNFVDFLSFLKKMCIFAPLLTICEIKNGRNDEKSDITIYCGLCCCDG